MKNLSTLFLAALLAVGIAFGQSDASEARPAYETGHLYLKLHNALTLELPQFSSAGGVVELKNHANPNVAKIGQLLEQYGAYQFRKPFRTHSTELDRTYEVYFSEADRTLELMRALADNELLEYAEQVPMVYLDKVNYTPNDYTSSQQWFLNAINATTAWDVSKGSSDVVIAIVDDQVQIDHPDLAANIWVNPGEIAGNGVDDDNNGYADDVNGWDVADNDADVFTETFLLASHGTHTAGCASAVSDNGIGVASIGYSCKIMVCKGTSDNNTNNPPTINNSAGGIDYAIDNGADVISMSFGSSSFSQTTQNLITAGWNKGIVFVASAGNDGLDHDASAANKNYPCGYTNVVCVGASGSNSQRASFSDYGTDLDLMAPGTGIRSTYCDPLNSYSLQDGTSMSTPIVSGLFGLMKAANPCLTNTQLVQYVKQTATAINHTLFTQGKLGSGIINAGAALQAVQVSLPPDPQFTFQEEGPCSDRVAFTYTDPGGLQACPESFSWTIADLSENIISSSSDQNPVITLPSGTATYVVTLFVQNTAGVNSLTDTITVNNGTGVFVNTPGTLSVCSGSPTLSGTTATVTPTAILWQPSTGLSNAGVLNPSITVTTSTTYVVTIQAQGCTAKDTLEVTPKSAPLTNIIQPTTQATHTITAGNSVTIKANGATSYAWSPATGLNQTTGATVVATPAQTTTYKVVGSYSNGCSRADSLTILVTVGVDGKLSQLAGIEPLTPNPADGLVTLSAVFHQTANVRIALHDLAGRELAEVFAGTAGEGDFSRDLDLQSFPAGVYLVSWTLNGMTSWQKLQVR